MLQYGIGSVTMLVGQERIDNALRKSILTYGSDTHLMARIDKIGEKLETTDKPILEAILDDIPFVIEQARELLVA